MDIMDTDVDITAIEVRGRLRLNLRLNPKLILKEGTISFLDPQLIQRLIPGSGQPDAATITLVLTMDTVTDTTVTDIQDTTLDPDITEARGMLRLNLRLIPKLIPGSGHAD